MSLPLTPDDLRCIAAALEPIELNEAIVKNDLIGRIEVYQPDGDQLIGYFQSAEMGDDDWYGFVAESQDLPTGENRGR